MMSFRARFEESRSGELRVGLGGDELMSCTRIPAFRILSLGVVLLVVTCGAPAKKEHQPAELTSSQHIRMAESMLTAGRVDDALAEVDKAIALEPENAQFYVHRGRLCFEGGRLDDAELAFIKALEIDPHLTDAHNFLGAVLNEEGRTDEAEREFRTVLDDPAYPTPEKGYFNLGQLYASQGRDVEAIDNLRRAVEINTKYYAAHFQLASVLDKTGKLEEAASEYEVAGPGYRASGDYHYQLGFVYFRLGRRDPARDSLRRAIEVAPGSRSAAKAGDLLKMLD